MSFHTSHFASGVMLPDEINHVQDVYDRIVALSWVSDDAKARERLARYVLSMYRRGLSDREKLYELCLMAARVQFAACSPNEGADQTDP
jgi:hypothetical protein